MSVGKKMPVKNIQNRCVRSQVPSPALLKRTKKRKKVTKVWWSVQLACQNTSGEGLGVFHVSCCKWLVFIICGTNISTISNQCETFCSSMLLNLWVSTLWGSYILDIYIMIHNRSKLQIWTSNENNFMVGGHHNMRNCIKGSQH